MEKPPPWPPSLRGSSGGCGKRSFRRARAWPPPWPSARGGGGTDPATLLVYDAGGGVAGTLAVAAEAAAQVGPPASGFDDGLCAGTPAAATATVVVVEVLAVRAFVAPTGRLCQHLPGERGLLRRLSRNGVARYGADAGQLLLKLPALWLGVRPPRPVPVVGGVGGGGDCGGGGAPAPPFFANTPILVGRLGPATAADGGGGGVGGSRPAPRGRGGRHAAAAVAGGPSRSGLFPPAPARADTAAAAAVAAAAAATAAAASAADRLCAEWAAGLAFGADGGAAGLFAPPPAALIDDLDVTPTAVGVRLRPPQPPPPPPDVVVLSAARGLLDAGPRAAAERLWRYLEAAYLGRGAAESMCEKKDQIYQR
ncbi:hypothetical protein BU14_0238s0015 [Porphyra umbilicalis]|uniref:Uncharacterized protein n=1 Tax=Porphyra umbilicalis TaxID=2786 RepID=A0A1X6P3B3_PORUM|nr:hypothetical protein BU14_0238s0015 [Porphyra umbilicalis]|eukprot:OSX75392.1 hypothetical protein BU14_0238s0015 [Porphyra umbilicalis]